MLNIVWEKKSSSSGMFSQLRIRYNDHHDSGMVRLPSLSDYWQRDPLFHNSIISDSMTRDRFFEILHFVNNSTTKDSTDDRHPHCQCSVDEAMVP